MLKKLLLSLLISFSLFLLIPRSVSADCKPNPGTRCNLTSCTSNGTLYCCNSQSECDQLGGNAVPLVTTAPSSTNTNSSPATSSSTGPTWYNQDFKTWLGKVDDPSNPSDIFGERYTSAQVEWVIWGVFAFFIHRTTPPGVVGTCINGDLTGCIDSIKTYLSTLAMAPATNQNLVQAVFADRPLSGISYIRHTVANFSLVPVAHAQTGTGFAALTAVQNLWTAFRNIAYGLFVIASVVLAFMIMFRVKISPQVVITVQSAIPKIVIALILVTFSYAIAGLLVDLMYVVIGLVSAVMAPVIPNASLLTGHSTFSAADVFNMLTIGPVTKTAGTSTASAGGIMGLLGMYFSPLILFLVVGLLVGVVLAATGVGVVVALIFAALILVVLIIMIWMAIKTIWALFKAFANVILLTIFAPLYLTLGILIPNFGFGSWVRSYFSHLAVFVTTGILWLLAWIFMLEAWVNSNNGANLVSAASGTSANPWPPLLNMGGGFGIFLVYIGVSFVLFTMIPKATELVQAAISGKPFAYGTAIGEAFGPFGGAAAYTRKYGTEGAVGFGAGRVKTAAGLSETDIGIRKLFFDMLTSLEANANKRPYENPYNTNKH